MQCSVSYHVEITANLYNVDPSQTRSIPPKMASYPSSKAPCSSSIVSTGSAMFPAPGSSVVPGSRVTCTTPGGFRAVVHMDGILAGSLLSDTVSFTGIPNRERVNRTVHQCCDDNEGTYCADSTTSQCNRSETNVCTATRSPLFPIQQGPYRSNTLPCRHCPAFPGPRVSWAATGSHFARRAEAHFRWRCARIVAILPGRALLGYKRHHLAG